MNWLRAIYHGLPLSGQGKYRLKSWFYIVLAPLIHKSRRYRHWLAMRRDLAIDVELSARAETGVTARFPQQFAEVFAASLRRGPYYQPIRARPVPPSSLKVIAFYLPQFHPFPENDAWWGRGFTEWTNVSKSVPQFVGHEQPKLPGELGFYDLRSKDVQRRQLELARLYGVHGFCYHHYWFAGKRLLQAPFEQVLADPSLDLPFCLCWANENWTRRWDGAEHDTLIAQKHSPEDDVAFIADILPALLDPRYIRVGGRPLLIVYRVSLLPEPKATAARWRKYCQEHGVGDIHLVAAQTFGILDPREYGFDAAVEFPPHNVELEEFSTGQSFFNGDFRGRVFRYAEVAERQRMAAAPDYLLYKCAFPKWDNSARKPGRGHVFHNATPWFFADWLRQAAEFAKRHHPPGDQITFVNAWNEWGEGAYLEPDRRNGFAYLEALGDVLTEHRIDPAEQLVTVVMLLGGDSLYVESAMSSVFAQTYRNLELIVIDDGSAEGSRAVVKRYSEIHPSLRIRHLIRSHGDTSTTIEVGVGEAAGDIIALMTSNEIFPPSRIEALVASMVREGADLAFSNVVVTSPSDAATASRIDTSEKSVADGVALLKKFPGLIYACLDADTVASLGNFVFRKRLYMALGLSPEEPFNNWDFLLRALATARAAFVEEPLYVYRTESGDPEKLQVPVGNDAVLRRFFASLDLEQIQILFPDRVYFGAYINQRSYQPFLPPKGTLAREWLCPRN
jgi:glycosyltransferase involved in cell wall biosynthesis